jgi:hypothetical protein
VEETFLELQEECALYGARGGVLVIANLDEILGFVEQVQLTSTGHQQQAESKNSSFNVLRQHVFNRLVLFARECTRPRFSDTYTAGGAASSVGMVKVTLCVMSQIENLKSMFRRVASWGPSVEPGQWQHFLLHRACVLFLLSYGLCFHRQLLF